MANKSDNAMTGKAVSSPSLSAAYQFSVEAKQPYLQSELSRELLDNLPNQIAKTLVDGFLSGKSLTGQDGQAVIDHFQTQSVMVPKVTAYPGTFALLEFMYGFQKVNLTIDRYFIKNLHAGVSLEARFQAVNHHASQHIKQILARQEQCLVLDLGSGPGRNGIALTLENPEFAARVQFHCVDTDPAAIAHGRQLAREHGLKNIHFVDKSMTRLHRDYRQAADYGLLIGVLCGLTTEERSGLLKIIRPYFKPGARVAGAGLLDSVLEADLFCAYILRETTGWILQHEPVGAIGQAFEMAGYSYEGYFQEEPTRCYEIGIGLA